MSITPAGVFSWTPTELQGGSDYQATITVTDDGTPSLDDSETITITVNEVNVAPVLEPIGAKSVDEQAPLSFQAMASDQDLPVDDLTFSLDSAAIALGMSITPAGVFSWTPTELQGGSDYQATITVTDDGTPSLDDSETITITVNEVNVAPVLEPIGAKSVDEQAPLSFQAMASDQDLPADGLTFSLDAAAIALGMSITPAGVFSWTPTELQGGSDYQATITVTDDGTPSLDDSETITITVNEVNVAPVLEPIGAKSVDEQAPLSFTATASDQDLPVDDLAFSLDAAAIALGMSITPAGVFSWTPTELQGGSDYQATITVTDDGTPSLDDSETITITVNEVNVAPVLEPIGAKSVDEQAELSFQAMARDQDLPVDDLAFSLDAAAIALGMSITPAGVFSWTPTELQGGSDYQATITVTDDGTPSLDDSETITITVNEVNVAPVLEPIGAKSVDEQAPLSFQAMASDQDLPVDDLTFSLDSAAIALGMSITPAGVFSWTPTELQGGSDYQATITVTDDGTPSLDDSETITITVNEVNVAPVLEPIGAKSVDEQAPLSFQAMASDQDLPVDDLTFSLDSAAIALGMSITPAGVFSWTPTELQGGSDYQATITVTDDGTPSLDDSETITITVNEVNVAPVLEPIGAKSVDEQAPLSFQAMASDQDLPVDDLTFSLDSAAIALGMSITPAGVFSWTPTELQGGSDYQATITVTDDGTPSLDDSETITITRQRSQRGPGAGTDRCQERGRAGPAQFPGHGQRPGPACRRLDLQPGCGGDCPGHVDHSPLESSAGRPLSSKVEATTRPPSTVTDDGTPSLDDSETITITVNEVNVAPVLEPIGAKSVDEQAPLSFTATASDQDLPVDDLAFSLDAAAIALGMSITPAGVFSWTPTELQGGSDYQATITVTDDGTPSLDDSETITITVNEVNVAPVLEPIGAKSVDEQAELSFQAMARDQDLPVDDLAFSLDAAAIALGMSITPAGVFSWTPTELQGGSDYQATITVTDDGTPSLDDSETITITVNEVNVAPVLEPIGAKSVDEQAELSFQAMARDQDLPVDDLAFSLDAAAIALGMSITPAGVFSWTPTELQGGSDYQATITVTDDGTPSLDDSETITITVNPLVIQAIDLGTVDFTEMSGLNVTGGDLWYELTTTRQGTLTAIVSSNSGTVTASLYTSPRTVPALAVSDVASGRLDHSTPQSETYLLRISGDSNDVEMTIANLVTEDETGVHVFGTDDADDFHFALVDSYLVTINGVPYHFQDVSDIPETFTFDGGEGIDLATFTGSAADESGRFFTGAGEFYSGSEFYDEGGFFVDAIAENLIAYSEGGRDFLKMYDSPGDDTFTSSPTVASLVGTGYSHTAYDLLRGSGIRNQSGRRRYCRR